MKQRLLALDVFRGMTIFFMILVNTPGSWKYVYAPLKHARWDGCTPTDFVFPFFMFIVGVSMAISYSGFAEKSKKEWINKALIRGFKIILIGLLLNWFPFYSKNISEIRIPGVLQRIGLGFTIAAILIVWIKPRYIIVAIVTILLAYWGILLASGEGAFTLDDNPVRSLDLLIFGENHIYKGYGIAFDPEGLLSTLPAIGTVLLGYLMGTWIISPETLMFKIKKMSLFGILCIILGLVWQYLGFPFNKPIWSSSYVLYTAGWGMLFLVVMIWMIDIKKLVGWTFIFKAFGKNPLISYTLSILVVKLLSIIKIADQSLYSWLYSTIFQRTLGDYPGSLMFAISFTMFIWLFAYVLDRKGVIIKV